jgi:glutathione S-transferase
MKLYYFETMNPRKVCATAKYLGSPVEYVRLNAAKGEHKSPEQLARNPNGKVPVLVDGSTTLWESAAIMIHLANQAGSDFWPAHAPALQAEVVRWISWDLCTFMPHAASFYFEHLIKPMFGMGEPDRAVLETKTPLVRDAAKVLDAQLAGRRYLVGDSFTVADFCVGVLLPYAQQIELPLSGFDNIARWHDGLMELDAWRNPWPAQ